MLHWLHQEKVCEFLSWIDETFPPESSVPGSQVCCFRFTGGNCWFIAVLCLPRSYAGPADLNRKGPICLRPWQLPWVPECGLKGVAEPATSQRFILRFHLMTAAHWEVPVTTSFIVWRHEQLHLYAEDTVKEVGELIIVHGSKPLLSPDWFSNFEIGYVRPAQDEDRCRPRRHRAHHCVIPSSAV